MDRLWAPWRKSYLSKKPSKSCTFCRIRRSKQDRKNWVVNRSKTSFSVLNLYPYNNGHVMVIPNRHVGSLEKLSDKETLDLMHLVNQTTATLRKRYKPGGLNIGVNIGRPSGAGMPGHVHVHIVPRWVGDTNFMPVISRTKIISESMESVHKRLTSKRKK